MSDFFICFFEGFMLEGDGADCESGSTELSEMRVLDGMLRSPAAPAGLATEGSKRFAVGKSDVGATRSSRPED